MVLQGKTILVTRQREQAGEIVEAIEQKGGRARVIPMIRILEPASWNVCDGAIGRLASYDAIIMTSGNAVQNFLNRCEAKGIFRSAFENKEVYAVGDRTSALLREFGLQATYTPAQFTSASLQEQLTRERVEGRRFLVPRGNLTSGELSSHVRALGGIVDEVDVYRNAPPTAETLEELSARFLNREFDVVTFASPSAIRNFRKAVIPNLFNVLRDRTLLAVIGPTTRTAALELGFSVDIEANESTGKGLVDAIVAFYLVQ